MSYILAPIRKCLRHCLRFVYARAPTGFAYAHILSYAELMLAYAHRVSLTPHPYEGPLLKHEHKGFERGTIGDGFAQSWQCALPDGAYAGSALTHATLPKSLPT